MFFCQVALATPKFVGLVINRQREAGLAEKHMGELTQNRQQVGQRGGKTYGGTHLCSHRPALFCISNQD